MGNCQAAEAVTVTVIIHHPASNKVEMIYWSVSANEIMTSNPGNYVALMVTSETLKNENGSPVNKHLKLLRPDDTLLIGQVYRLVSFEDVLKEFAAKKSVKLGKLLRNNGALGLEMKKKVDSGGRNTKSDYRSSTRMEQEVHHVNRSRTSAGGGQWRPALHSIAEHGT